MTISDSFFLSEGLLSQKLENFEYRPQQAEMARKVESVICDRETALIEAGPGTGKSMAYLIPALSLNRFPVIISTHTINLQNQLVSRDIPRVTSILDRKVKTLLLKGRNNYLCRYRSEEVSSKGLEADLFNHREIKKLLTLFSRIMSLNVKDREEIPFAVPPSLWHQISSDSDTCLRSRCPHFKNCFFYQQRRKISESEIIVTNHALFFRELYPKLAEENFPVLIFDEAHHLIRCAESYFTVETDPFRMLKLLRIFQKLLLKTTDPRNVFDSVSLSKDLERRVTLAFQKLSASEKDNRRMPLAKNTLENSGWTQICNDLLILSGTLEKLEASGIEFENPEFSKNFSRMVDNACVFMDFCEDEYVFYTQNSENSLTLKAAGLDFSQKLSQELFVPGRSHILTSATISVNRNFDYLKRTLGISQCEELSVESPYNFRKQSIMYLPDLSDVDSASYVTQAGNLLEELLDITSGRAFILFTSQSMLDRFAESLSDSLRLKGYSPLRQGDLPRNLMLDEFIRLPSPVLFGLDSFWEGVDIPGDDLSLVAIMRLPFSVPDDPLLKRKSDILSAEGKNPFLDLSLPEAVLRLKQGFGRLIRTGNDRGIMAMFDSRIRKKWYGRTILDSLPDMKKTDLLSDIRDFFHE